MREITAERGHVDLKAFHGKPVTTAGMRELEPDTLVRDGDGKLLLAYVRLWEGYDEDAENLRRALLNLEIGYNTSGIVVRSMPFGRRGRALPRRDYCGDAALEREHPETAAMLTALGKTLDRRYRQLTPIIHAHHVAQASRILPEWKLPGSCYTGGVINRDSAIGWHRDSGNFRSTMSAMPIWRKDVGGGQLVCPELGAVIPTEDGTAVFFDGQSLVHGVTPITKLRASGHRITVVYYSEVKLWQCLPPDDELRRAQQRRVSREVRRAKA